MRAVHHTAFSRLSLQSVVYFLAAVSVVLFALAAARNPLAVALPISGTIAAAVMVWSIDQLQSRVPIDAVVQE